jgi:hypothetical protein
VSVYDEGDNFY